MMGKMKFFLIAGPNLPNSWFLGFCLDTVVREEQCEVPNAYCNERSITCQCKPGFELQMDFDNKEDKASYGFVFFKKDSKFSG